MYTHNTEYTRPGGLERGLYQDAFCCKSKTLQLLFIIIIIIGVLWFELMASSLLGLDSTT
jgi:hypothetical protein